MKTEINYDDTILDNIKTKKQDKLDINNYQNIHYVENYINDLITNINDLTNTYNNIIDDTTIYLENLKEIESNKIENLNDLNFLNNKEE